MKKLGSIAVVFGLFSLITWTGCHKDDEKTEFEKINDWIYDEMDTWYLWTDDLPKKSGTNVSPRDFYESLLSPEDRFSFIYDDYEELVNLLNGVTLESGFEFKLYLESEEGTNVIMQLVYIKKGSPADLLGLKRGDVIYEINGVQFTTSNYQKLLSQTNETYDATYRRYNAETKEFKDQGVVSILPTTFAEDPILMDTVYEINGKKIGYLVYTFFSPGPTGSSTIYDEEVDAVFGRFKGQGITDFILDLRFNSGGSEISARNLSSLIVNATSSDLMFKKQYNDLIQETLLNDDRYGSDFLHIKFNDEPQNISQTISTNTAYIITSDRSASASEVVINSIRPYMDIFIVGDTTVGKDVGSITINEEDNEENNWAIQPIVVKIVNADDQDYSQGFYPDLLIEDRFLVLTPLGDTNEPLLNGTLSAIGVQNARLIPEWEYLDRNSIYESIDEKKRSGKFIMKKLELN